MSFSSTTIVTLTPCLFHLHWKACERFAELHIFNFVTSRRGPKMSVHAAVNTRWQAAAKIKNTSTYSSVERNNLGFALAKIVTPPFVTKQGKKRRKCVPKI